MKDTWMDRVWTVVTYGVGGGVVLFVVTHYVFPALLVLALILLCPRQKGGW